MIFVTLCRASILLIAACTLLSGTAYAKSKQFDWSDKKLPLRMSATEIRSLENRLSPYFENRIFRRHHRKAPPSKAIYSSTEADLLLLAKTWDRLSPEFKQLYQEAAQLPDSFLTYVSPNGHFEIYYSLSGFDAVDTTDDFGYRTPDWRSKVLEPNGIPDYIDETAFILDSCRSMEIDRFGFIAPPAFKDKAHPSDRYKVVVEAQEESYYGLTYLHGESTGTHGYISTISLRNEWAGPEWSSLGYNKKPFNAIRVTCAHEFFHAIQYAMSWKVLMDIWLDDFPLSWTEGTAVSMEELAFDSVNDYHQYAQTYFNNPGISFFNRATSDLVYTNAILVIYLFRHIKPGGGIDFIHDMLFNNYSQRAPFHENLLAAAVNAGRSWTGLLHDFHTASFFTGSHADSIRFTADASFFTMKTVTPIGMIDTIAATIPLNSVKQVRLIRESGHGDSVAIDLSASDETAAAGNCTFACSALLRKQGADSIIAFPIDSSGKGGGMVASWKNWDELTVIVTNGDPISEKKTSLFIQPYPVTYPKSTLHDDTIIDNQYYSAAIIHLEAKNDLHAPLKFESARQNPATGSGTLQQFTAFTGLYSITIPPFWHENADIHLLLQSTAVIDTTDSAYLCRWDETTAAWLPLARSKAQSADSARISVPVTESGIYALCRKSGQSIKSPRGITIYPNPLSLRKHGGTAYFRGNSITDIRIYSITGALVWRFPSENFNSSSPSLVVKYPWNCKNGSGTEISPGIYTVMTVQNDPLEQGQLRQRRKLLITP